ncbi:MAG: hypothetical protein PHU80_11095 [Kiritimatiellae bacterium]|nr:hypothetical protein [Kiritimatiellia bacterium]
MSGDFIVGKPTEIERLFDSTTIAYDGGLMSNAVCYATEAIKRYEASKRVAAEKIGFTTPSLKTQMSYFYRIQAEALFSNNETVEAMGFMRTALALDPDNVTNQVVGMCLATDLDDYATQISYHHRFRNSPGAIKLTFFSEVIKRGWLLPFDLTNEDFLDFENTLGITNRLDRPIYYIDKTNGHKIVRRWRGLDQYRECDFTELKEHARDTMKVEQLLNKMQVARKECVITGMLDLASNCLAEYDRLSSDYIKEHPALKTIPTRCYLTLAEARMANKEYEAAMTHVLQAEQCQPGVTVDILKTMLWALNDNADQATRLALKYMRAPVGDKKRSLYFASLIETGYIADSRYLSDASFDIKAVYGLDCDIARPVIMRSYIEGGGRIGNGEMLQQWTGLNTTRFEPFGPLRQRFWNGKVFDDCKNKPFCLDTLEVSNPSSNGLDVVLVVTSHYEKVYSYIWNDPKKEIGWYNFDTQERATNVFVRDENILWFSNPSAKLTRFALRGAIELKEVGGFPRDIKTHKVSSEPQKTMKWKQKRLGDDSFEVGWIKKELNLVPDSTLVPPYRLSISNTVIAVSTNGRPAIAQLRFVDKKQRKAKWYSPFSTQPSPILFGDIVSYSANIPSPDWLDKVVQVTYARGRELCWQKSLQILNISKEEFSEEPFVYCGAAVLLVGAIMILTKALKFACSRIIQFCLFLWGKIRAAVKVFYYKLQTANTGNFLKENSFSLLRKLQRWKFLLCIRRYRSLKRFWREKVKGK